jgi:hypothetical protein
LCSPTSTTVATDSNTLALAPGHCYLTSTDNATSVRAAVMACRRVVAALCA